jgi:two-component system response regulator AtoC
LAEESAIVIQQNPINGPTILLAEDDREVRDCIQLMLQCKGFQVETAGDGEELLGHFRGGPAPAAVVLDIMMPNLDGFETLREIRSVNQDIPVVMLSGLSTPLNVVNAMKCGATDFLAKPVNHEDLRRVLSNALESRADGLVPNVALPSKEMFFGQTAAMQALKTSLRTVAASDAPILIEGETGTGKEMLARQIHQSSLRADGPFIKLNCAAVPSELLESELFGYERGAFTGAMHRKPGVFELANGGTLLLDEIGDMELRLQSKLLQVVQDQEFRRLGGRDTVHVNVRLLSATHCNLLNAVAVKTFREDLYYRLNVFTLTVPSLRERRADIPGITDFLIRKHVKPGSPAPIMTERLRNALVSFSWPGNIRQLENVVRKLVVLNNPNLVAQELEALMEPARASEAGTENPAAKLSPKPEIRSHSVLEQVAQEKADAEAKVILDALRATRWNRKQAAARLQIDYKAFLYKMKKLAIEEQAELSA